MQLAAAVSLSHSRKFGPWQAVIFHCLYTRWILCFVYTRIIRAHIHPYIYIRLHNIGRPSTSTYWMPTWARAHNVHTPSEHGNSQTHSYSINVCIEMCICYMHCIYTGIPKKKKYGRKFEYPTGAHGARAVCRPTDCSYSMWVTHTHTLCVWPFRCVCVCAHAKAIWTSIQIYPGKRFGLLTSLQRSAASRWHHIFWLAICSITALQLQPLLLPLACIWLIRSYTGRTADIIRRGACIWAVCHACMYIIYIDIYIILGWLDAAQMKRRNNNVRPGRKLHRFFLHSCPLARSCCTLHQPIFIA